MGRLTEVSLAKKDLDTWTLCGGKKKMLSGYLASGMEVPLNK